MHGQVVESGRKWCGLASSWAFTTWSFFLPGKALQGVNRERERERVVSSRGKPRVYVLHFEIDGNVCAVRAETHIKAKIV